ncbi:MAG: transcription antitermination factor NusB [Clostridia bacterium]|nr:transcription antitermination factor NusB [Clostridia bacterium]
MSVLKRREAREIVIGLLFESEFRADEDYVAIFATSCEEREIPSDPYVKNAYYTIFENQETIDEWIGRHAHGWKTNRMSKLSRSILRLAVYEMLYEKEIPYSVTINEAVELTKKFDEDRARAFVNGILNSVKSELEAGETDERKS